MKLNNLHLWPRFRRWCYLRMFSVFHLWRSEIGMEIKDDYGRIIWIGTFKVPEHTMGKEFWRASGVSVEGERINVELSK
jgi:hypothetical protein